MSITTTTIHSCDTNQQYVQKLKPQSNNPSTIIDIDIWLDPIYHLYEDFQYQLGQHYKATRKEINYQLNKSHLVGDKISTGAVVFKTNNQLLTKKQMSADSVSLAMTAMIIIF